MNFTVSFAISMVGIQAQNGDEAQDLARKSLMKLMKKHPKKVSDQMTVVKIVDLNRQGMTRDEFDAVTKGSFGETELDPNDLQSADDFNPDIAKGKL